MLGTSGEGRRFWKEVLLLPMLAKEAFERDSRMGHRECYGSEPGPRASDKVCSRCVRAELHHVALGKSQG